MRDRVAYALELCSVGGTITVSGIANDPNQLDEMRGIGRGSGRMPLPPMQQMVTLGAPCRWHLERSLAWTLCRVVALFFVWLVAFPLCRWRLD